MVSIRFIRVGRPGVHVYRLGVMDSRRSTKTPPLEVLAAYNPSAKDGEKLQNLKKDRLDHWLKVGAQLSEGADRLLQKEKVIPARPRVIPPAKPKPAAEAPKAEAPKAA